MKLKHLAVFALTILTTSAPVPCGAAPWSVALGTDADEEGLAVAGAYDGSILVGGARRVAPGNDDAFAACFDVRGSLLWQTSFGGLLEDAVTSAAAHPQGGWIVAGTRNGTANTKAFVARLGTDGSMAWERTWPGMGAHVAVRRDGSIVVGTENPGRLVAFDSRGYILWRKAWVDTTHVTSVSAAPDSSLLITGVQWLNQGTDWPVKQDFLALLAPDGTPRWARLDGCAGSVGPACFLRDGSVFVVIGGGAANLGLDGSLRRFRKIAAPRAAFEALVQTPTGVIAAGTQVVSWSDPSLDEAGLTRLRDDLTVQAAIVTRRAGEDHANAVTLLNDASTVVVGSTQRGDAGGDHDVYVLRLEPLLPSGACDLASAPVTALAPASYPLLPLTLVTTWNADVIQSAHDPIHPVFAAPRPPCGG